MASMSTDSAAAERHRTLLWILIALVFYLALSGSLYVGIRHANEGHFLFALDDPYIHLALSDQIAHGHYGINPGEASSPSSSIIWPLLLAPFARFTAQPQIALFINLLAGIATSILIGFAVASWPGWEDTADENWRRAISAVALVLMGNLVGLTLLGMEHTLQVMLAGGCAYGLITCLREKRIPTWCLICAALGPSVRYESVALTAAIAIALVGLGQIRKAVGLVLISILPLAAFSVMLHHLGLPLLPSSVLVKGSAIGSDVGFVHQIARQIKRSLEATLTDPYRYTLAVLTLTLVGLAWKERVRLRRYVLGAAALAGVLHLSIGTFGWSFRYEVYMVFFCGLMVLYVLHERPRMIFGWYVLGLFWCVHSYVTAAHRTVRSSHEIYLQQYQTHRFLQDFYTGDSAAVNDLGLTSYRRRSGLRIVDLEGLGSVESARQKNKTTAWMDSMIHEHRVGVVIIYEDWFSPAPADWTKLGELCMKETPIAVYGPCVSFFATPFAPPQTANAYSSFVKTLPPGIEVVKPNEQPHYNCKKED